MKRTLSIALVLILILASIGASCAFASGSYLGTLTVINCREWVSLRSSPDKNSDRIAAVPLGARVEAYYYNSEFTECYYNGCWGYILSTYLSNGSGGGSSAGGANYLGQRTIVNCNEFVTLRSTPSTKAPAVTRVARGETVQCYEYSSEFAYCYYNGLSGYILTKYISGMGGSSYGYGGGYSYTYNTPSYSPRRSNSILYSLMDDVNFYDYYPGFETFGSPAVGSHVNEDGTWTWATFFETDPGLDMRVAYCNEFVSLRAEASTSSARLQKVPLGAYVLGYGEYGKWTMCNYNGTTGWVLSEYLYCIG